MAQSIQCLPHKDKDLTQNQHRKSWVCWSVLRTESWRGRNRISRACWPASLLGEPRLVTILRNATWSVLITHIHPHIHDHKNTRTHRYIHRQTERRRENIQRLVSKMPKARDIPNIA